jgi:hypothetical protein
MRCIGRWARISSPASGSRSTFSPVPDIDDRFSELVGVTRAFGVIARHLPSAILILPKPVSRSPPKTSSIYPSSISRALCSAGMRCIKPLAPSRNETNSSRVNIGADKTSAIRRICAYGWPVQASHPATINLTHYLDGARRGALAGHSVSRQASHHPGDCAARAATRSLPGARSQ